LVRLSAQQSTTSEPTNQNLTTKKRDATESNQLG
jgi:hypothetical protein